MLAIGIVVDDAIVVVENVERYIALGPVAARRGASGDARGHRPDHRDRARAVRGVHSLAFITGLTGQFYKQFALTIAISTVISAFNSSRLSRRSARCCSRTIDAPQDLLTRWIARFGWFFRRFNRAFAAASHNYTAA